MKLDVNNFEWEDFDDLPAKEKIVKKKKKDLDDKELKSKKNDNYRKRRKNPDENI